MFFSYPGSVTPEEIATALDAEGWLTIADPSAETAESLATALEAAGYYDFANPTTETAESVALVLNALPEKPTIHAASTGTLDVRVWWNSVPRATGFKLYRDGSLRATLGAVGSTIDAGTQNQTYAYQVRATNATSMGPYSNEVWAAPTDASYVDFDGTHTHARRVERTFG